MSVGRDPRQWHTQQHLRLIAPDEYGLLILRDPFYVPVVPMMQNTRMATTRLSLFQITTVRQAQIESHRIYWTGVNGVNLTA
jgi:hypothetical protein